MQHPVFSGSEEDKQIEFCPVLPQFIMPQQLSRSGETQRD